MLEGIIAILGLIGGFGVGVLKYWKYVKAAKEAVDVVKVSADAFKDGKLSPQEQQSIYKEITEVFAALGLTI